MVGAAVVVAIAAVFDSAATVYTKAQKRPFYDHYADKLCRTQTQIRTGIIITSGQSNLT